MKRPSVPAPATKFGPSNAPRRPDFAVTLQAKRNAAVPPPPTRFGGGALQSKLLAPLRSPVIQKMNEEFVSSRPKREVRKTGGQVEAICQKLSLTWSREIVAGSLDGAIALDSGKGHNCAALGLLDNGTTIEARFDSDTLHAEMAVLELAQSLPFGIGLTQINIEKQPCPRCAVVINQLGIGDIVKFKQAGCKKDYPTWRFPSLRDAPSDSGDWANILGAEWGMDERDQEEIKTYFRSQKWW